MAEIYFDADVKPDFRRLLEMRWHNVLTTQEHGRLDAVDADQLVTAKALKRILITHNGKDFRTLCQAWRVWRPLWGLAQEPHPGVIAIPQQTLLPYNEAARQIDRLFASRGSVENELWYFDLRVGNWVRQI